MNRPRLLRGAIAWRSPSLILRGFLLGVHTIAEVSLNPDVKDCATDTLTEMTAWTWGGVEALGRLSKG